jgi:hypothetical protein
MPRLLQRQFSNIANADVCGTGVTAVDQRNASGLEILDREAQTGMIGRILIDIARL